MTKCTQCDEDVGATPYNPMPEWKIRDHYVANVIQKILQNIIQENMLD